MPFGFLGRKLQADRIGRIPGRLIGRENPDVGPVIGNDSFRRREKACRLGLQGGQTVCGFKEQHGKGRKKSRLEAFQDCAGKDCCHGFDFRIRVRVHVLVRGDQPYAAVAGVRAVPGLFAPRRAA